MRKNLLAEINFLAREYGWTESEILNLPDLRRESYVALALEKYKDK